MSKRELRHEYPYPSEVFMCEYSRSMYLNVIQITLYFDDIRLIHISSHTHVHISGEVAGHGNVYCSINIEIVPPRIRSKKNL